MYIQHTTKLVKTKEKKEGRKNRMMKKRQEKARQEDTTLEEERKYWGKWSGILLIILTNVKMLN